jgi:hypothetical protein
MKRLIMMLVVATAMSVPAMFVPAMSVPAMAASVTNKDADIQVLVIVEDGSRVEVALEPGSTETICPAGCFVTLPNGDRMALNGGETVEIVGGSASVK